MDKKEIKKELILRELASRSLKYFTEYTKPDYEMIATQWGKWIHEKIIEKLEWVTDWKIKRLMIFVRPRMWKSELSSIRLPNWFIWKNPDKKVVVASYSWDIAANFWRKGREIVKSQDFKNIFPDFQLSRAKAEWGNRETTKWWGLYCVWVWWSLTSRWFDIGIIDDPVKDRQEAESPTIQERVKDWYTSTFYTRCQQESSAIILMMTRWNVNDLAWFLLEQEREWWDKWEVLTIPAIDEEWNEIIWPWKWSEWHIKEVKKNISPKDWAALYQQDPISSSSNIFNLQDLRYYLQSDFEKADGILKKEDLKCIIYVDPAFSSSDSSDEAVVLWLWKHKISGNYYQLDWYADTSAPSHTFRAILSMYDRLEIDWYKIDSIYIEDVKLNKDQSKFIEDFKKFLKENDRYIIVNWDKPKGRKEDRIKFILEPKTSTNAVFLRKDMADKSFIKRLERQLYEFPNAKHDDIIDCLAWWLNMLDTRWTHEINNKPKEYHNKITWQLQKTWQRNRNQMFWL